jgi:hypothetical protein
MSFRPLVALLILTPMLLALSGCIPLRYPVDPALHDQVVHDEITGTYLFPGGAGLVIDVAVGKANFYETVPERKLYPAFDISKAVTANVAKGSAEGPAEVFQYRVSLANTGEVQTGDAANPTNVGLQLVLGRRGPDGRLRMAVEMPGYLIPELNGAHTEAITWHINGLWARLGHDKLVRKTAPKRSNPQGSWAIYDPGFVRVWGFDAMRIKATVDPTYSSSRKLSK